MDFISTATAVALVMKMVMDTSRGTSCIPELDARIKHQANRMINSSTYMWEYRNYFII